MSLIM